MKVRASRQGGFTLIELIVVIVLLGILGAVATARYQDLSGAANAAAQQGIASEIQGSSAVNYAAAVLPGSTPAVSIDATNNACATIIPGLFQSGAMPTGYTVPVAAAAPACTAAGDTVACAVTQTGVGNFNVSLLCTGG